MNMQSNFRDHKKHYVITIFIQEDDFEEKKAQIQDLGNQKNVTLVVQPCPFEAIEFLYRVDFDIEGHLNSFEKSYFWQALDVKLPKEEVDLKALSEAHHAYLVAIVQNDAQEVQKRSKQLQSLL